ncbi:HAD family hydrolase [Stutzerimonas kirkiae]|uniref:Haloacid dehalogenase n=1 Tax=Stutzerimonas kirkiae TaxID=2211392 RepID=A0A4Q9QY67_9GAMM|nr:HAD-IA family hydrolase [Stutzerimonas kirkiae]TBU88857.1 haloacid dehalogenase [Stutzerimonas kirkiae]TBU99019.1 haloacid dehalogenase [Stutzerimonas kirkiae]TBV04176.1 haloacid dehalogenase [Stutzerimonas kirkiae]TBV15402.1 haloacid dehalogenase [Stutzerimonas kirkiae]
MPASICVIFDLDGTLVDSEHLNNRAFLELLPELDLDVESLASRSAGRQLAVILDDLAALLGHPLPPGFEQAYRRRVATLFESELRATPGTVGMLQHNPFSRCVASSAPKAKIEQALRVSGLRDFFDTGIFSSYDIGSWKPEPGIFLHAAESMGFAPRDCLVIEDSEAGLRAADAAGMTALHYIPPGSLATPSAQHAHLRDMGELPRLLAGRE